MPKSLRPPGVTLVHAVADVVAAVVGDASQPHAHAVQLLQALDTVADGQVLQSGQEPDPALLLGGLDVGGVADPDDAVLHGNVGDHVPHLRCHIVVFYERHVGGALQATEDVGRSYGRPSASPRRVVTPLVAPDADKVDQLVHHLGKDEGVLVDVDGDSLLGDGLVSDLLAGVQGNDRGRNAAHLPGQGDLCSHVKLRWVGCLLSPFLTPVIPTRAGIQKVVAFLISCAEEAWIPAFARMTAQERMPIS